MNRIIIVGRLTTKPELKTTSGDIQYARFSIACDRNFQSSNKEKVTDFINAVAWRQQATFISTYLDKGSLVYIEGRLQSSSFTDKDGNKRTSMEVVVDTVRGLESKAQSAARQSAVEQGQYDYQDTSAATNNVDVNNDPYSEFGDNVPIDDNFLD